MGSKEEFLEELLDVEMKLQDVQGIIIIFFFMLNNNVQMPNYYFLKFFQGYFDEEYLEKSNFLHFFVKEYVFEKKKKLLITCSLLA